MSRSRVGGRWSRRRRVVVGVVGAVVAVALVGVGVLAWTFRPLSSAAVDAAVQDRLAGVVADRDDVAGAVLAVHDGRTGELRQYAAGTTHVGGDQPVTVDSRFHAASVGKVLLAAVVGQLVDEGTVSFDDPVDRWLDDELRGLFVVDGTDHAPRVTIGQLLDHTSGAADYFAGPVTAGPTTRELMVADPDRTFTPQDLLAISRERQVPVGVPGERFAYSDTGYVLLGLALEEIEGRPYDEILAARLFAPLGMRDSEVWTPSDPPSDLLAIDVDGVDVSGRAALSVDRHGGGVVTTAADLVTFVDAFEGGDLVSAGVHERLTRPVHALEDGIWYGSGVATVRFTELSPLLGTMADVRGGLGATGTYALYDPSQGTTYVAHLGSLDAARLAVEELVQVRLLLDRLDDDRPGR